MKNVYYIPVDLLTSVDWDTETSKTLSDLKHRVFNLVKCYTIYFFVHVLFDLTRRKQE